MKAFIVATVYSMCLAFYVNRWSIVLASFLTLVFTDIHMVFVHILRCLHLLYTHWSSEPTEFYVGRKMSVWGVTVPATDSASKQTFYCCILHVKKDSFSTATTWSSQQSHVDSCRTMAYVTSGNITSNRSTKSRPDWESLMKTCVGSFTVHLNCVYSLLCL